MARTFAYLRVSTAGQTTGNQLQEITAAGFKVELRHLVTETVSGNVATSQPRGFARLLDRLEPGDVLVVTKLDRLGRNAMDGRLSSEVRGRPRDLGLISLQRCTSPGNGRGRR
jgi:putative DNA-invertase from lambdoid prophage Rac